MRKTQIFIGILLIAMLLLLGACAPTPTPAPTPAPAPTPVPVLLNPYIPKAHSYKGQLHCHTTYSDGVLTPAELETAYRDAGYSFVCITDHSTLLPVPAPDPGVEDILHMNGVEEHTEDGHVGNIGCIKGARGSNDANTQLIINKIIADGAIPSLCHPASPETFDILGLEGYILMEIWNGVVKPDVRNAEFLWDDALSAGKEVWGIAGDDYHSLETGDFDVGWVMVFADKLTREDILNGLRSGNFYTSQGPSLSISVSGNVITVSTEASSKFEWIGPNGTILRTKSGVTIDDYLVTGAEDYVRVRVTRGSDGLTAWSQPIRSEL